MTTKKEIGIVTIGDYNNYGNRLQNFALYYVISHKLGHNVHTILNFKNYEPAYKIDGFKDIARAILKYRTRYVPVLSKRNSLKTFSSHWTKEYIPEHARTRIDVDHTNFDKIVLGSDQVWNFQWQTLDQAQYFMLENVPSVKRIGYAVSMGNPPIKNDFLNIFNKEIINFHQLSVREDVAKSYLKETFDVSSEVVLDPTMLLTKDEWVYALSINSKKITRYILTYFLSEPSKKMKQLIKDTQMKKHLEVINLLNLNGNNLKYFDVDPKEKMRSKQKLTKEKI